TDVLTLVASLERYSKHPLSSAILDAARDARVTLLNASEVSEPPGEGLRGVVAGRTIQVTSRMKLPHPETMELPPPTGGLECVIVIDGRYAATLRFCDKPRAEGASFIHHLRPKHHFDR